MIRLRLVLLITLAFTAPTLGQGADESEFFEFKRNLLRLLETKGEAELRHPLRKARFAGAQILENRWRLLYHWKHTLEKDLSNKSRRFKLLESYLLDCHYSDGLDVAAMVRDYMKLKDDLRVVDDAAVVTEETAQFLIDNSGPRYAIEGQHATKLFDQSLKILQERPDDAAPFHVLTRLSQLATKKVVDFELLKTVCTSPRSKVQLVYLMRYARSDIYRLEKEIVRAAVPHLANDEERGALLWHFFMMGSAESRQPHVQFERLPKFINSYPRTTAAKEAFTTLLYTTIGSRGVDSALQLIEEFKDRVGLDANAVAAHKCAIVSVCLGKASEDPRMQIGKHSKQAHDAERILAELLAAPVDPATRVSILTLAVQFNRLLEREEELGKAIEQWLALIAQQPRPLSKSSVAREIAERLMAQGRYADAIVAWRQWGPSCGGCGSWAVDPSEWQRYQIAICYLCLQDSNSALDEILEGLLLHGYCNGQYNLVPHLLFYIYDRAGQMQDLHRIALEIEATEIRILSNPMIYHGPRVDPEPLLPADQEWGVRQLLRVRQLSEDGDLKNLCCILSSNHGTAFQRTENHSEYPALEATVAWEAMLGLSKHTEKVIQIIDDSFHGEDSERLSDWHLLALLKNSEPKSKEWLLDRVRGMKNSKVDSGWETGRLLACLWALGDEGKALIDEIVNDPTGNIYQQANSKTHLAYKPFELKFLWPAPKAQSLPKSLLPEIEMKLKRKIGGNLTSGSQP